VTGPPAAAIIERLLPAPAEVVFAEWTDPAALGEWMCPRPAVATNVTVELRVGGRLRFDIDDGADGFFVVGEYVTIDPPTRLAFTWWCSTWPIDAPTSLVTVSLAPRANETTLMTIRHEQLAEDLLERHEVGWAAIAEQLSRRLVER
jgi:uncharacterized protein YndB with AHSA1/START domain